MLQTAPPQWGWPVLRVSWEMMIFLPPISARVKRLLEVDLAKIVCISVGTLLVGFDSHGRAIVNPRIEGEVRVGSKENPWLAVSAWREDLLRRGDLRSEYGVKVGSSMKWSSDIYVRPYYGVVKYKSSDDRHYAL
ncbi:MAG: hypothetical protein N2578_05865 [Bdellovibrionaceae bacterium]|nr:hypothetical protein [Pseudobdellovibrionaceae bacterium]